MSSSSASSPQPSSMEAVLSTVELLNEILLRVDMRTLLVSGTRVSRCWADVIKSSPSLQRKLFMLPCDADFVTVLLNYDDSIRECKNPQRTKIQNPVLGELLPSLFPAERRGSSDDWKHELRFAAGVAWGDDIGRQLRPVGEWPSLAWSADRDAAVWERPDASWRKMLVQQPPVKKLLIVADVKPEVQQDAIWQCHVIHQPQFSDNNLLQASQSHGICLNMEELYHHLNEILVKETYGIEPGWNATWWMPKLPLVRARVLSRINYDRDVYRLGYLRPGYPSFEVSYSRFPSSSRTERRRHNMWIDRNLDFNEDDGADLIFHPLNLRPFIVTYPKKVLDRATWLQGL